MARVYSFIELIDRELEMFARALGIEGPANFEFVTQVGADERRVTTAVWTHQKGKIMRGQLELYVMPLDLEPRLTPPPVDAA